MSKKMSFKDETLSSFLRDLASFSPTPGGGSASAVCGAMAASLVEMVANLTIDKKGYEKVKERVKEIKKKVKKNKDELFQLADKDAEAFIEVMKAYHLEKKDEKRKSNIESSLKKATSVPLRTACLAREVEEYALFSIKKGNSNAVSDAKCALHMANAAKKGAIENVLTNLKSIQDEKFVKKIKEEVVKLT